MQGLIKALIKSVLPQAHSIEVEVPKNEKYGDYSTNAAIILAKSENIPPRSFAAEIVEKLKRDNKYFSEIEATPQGFINFRLSKETLERSLLQIIKKTDKYGQTKIGKGQKVLIEFVSANPTGPLHIGHGRWAVIGDCLANILKAGGSKVDTEFYVNDAGEQVEKLIDSIIARMEGRDVPEGGYAGKYILEMSEKLKNKNDRSSIKKESLKLLISEQKKTLNDLGVKFDKWFYESELHRKNLIKRFVDELDKRGLTFSEGGSIWFKSSEYGDDKNRVLIKEDGSPTYFAADIAYHVNKLSRGYVRLINVWGTDHHGYVARLKAALLALGYPSDRLEIIIGQLVALYRNKELIRMSKRTGEMITLEEVIEEIGSDATRYFLVKNSPNTHIDFDLELAKSKSLENPVYYVCYAHARICSILKEAKKVNLAPKSSSNLGLLSTDVERNLMLKLLRFQDEVENAAKLMQPHRLTCYAEELAWLFHNYYHQHRVISDEKYLSTARLTLAFATSVVLKNVLKLLGITAPEHM